MTIQKAQIFPGMFTQMQATCNTCAGKGKTVARPCPHCRGQKVVQGENNLSFYLPPGAHEGFEMLFDGEADESPDWDVPGDVLVKVYARTDDEWRRKDSGLYRREIIGVDEALLGFERNVTHLDGKTVRIVRPGTTQPGHVDVIKGEGVGTGSLSLSIVNRLSDIISTPCRCLLTLICRTETFTSSTRSSCHRAYPIQQETVSSSRAVAQTY